MKIDDLATQAGEWMKGTGPESDIVISTRLRLARNVREFPFLTQATPEARSRYATAIRSEIESSALAGRVSYFNLPGLDPIDRLFLVERHLISREHANQDGDRGVAFAPEETLSIMINEEDHLRIQVLRSGFELATAFSEIDQVDDLLESRLTWAFSPQFGYLTACPTNVGTAMRVSVMLHLPALVLTKQLEKVFASLNRISFTVRGLYGEGTQATGDFYQISNQSTLGKTEAEILSEMSEVVPAIARFERTWREKLVEENRSKLEDKIFRAYGILRNARLITSEEAMELLSFVRLGLNLNLLPEVTQKQVNEIFIFSQPAHLQKVFRQLLEPQERDEARARYVRERLADGRK